MIQQPQPMLNNKQKLYQLAEWLITGMLLIFGFQYLRQIVAFVMMALYRLLIVGSAI